MESAKNAVLAAAIELMKQDVERLCGKPFSRKLSEDRCHRGGSETTSLMVDGAKHSMKRPRVRKDGEEVPLPSLEKMRDQELLDQDMLARVVRGVSTRNYEGVINGFADKTGIKKSSVSRAFKRASKKDLDNINGRDLSQHKFVGILVDGTGVGGSCQVVAVGITDDSQKIPLGLEAGARIEPGLSQKLFPNYRSDVVKGQQAELPDLAIRFLEVMAATSKKNTVNGYQTALRGFYRLHQMKADAKPYRIDRADIETYMIHLKDKEMGPNERGARLLQIRKYLDWLYDHRKLKVHPDILIKSADFPKRIKHLPRPFPVNVDIELQKRLDENGGIDFLGVLLMRRTGLRVGELCDLTLDCITTDLNSNWFLKVPLGKLNSERVIPLDPKTVEVVQRIQKFHPSESAPDVGRRFLISNPSGRRRSRAHFAIVLEEATKDLAIPGKVTLHRLRHTFATTLLSAGLPITTLKQLLGHNDIRMTLNYAAVTLETVRTEFFEALAKNQSRYETAAYPLKLPDQREGMNRAIYDAQKYAKKIARDRADIDPDKVRRLLGRLMTIRQELSDLLM